LQLEKCGIKKDSALEAALTSKLIGKIYQLRSYLLMATIQDSLIRKLGGIVLTSANASETVTSACMCRA